MAALTDVSWGLAAESTPGTYVAPTRWFEVLPPDFEVRKSVKQGKGLRVGSRAPRGARRVVTSMDAGGSVPIELVSKGFGLLLESMLGAATSTLVSGSTYQQVFTLATGTTLPSRTLQTGVVKADGTVAALSYLGSTVDTWDLELPNDDIALVTTSWDCTNYSTSQAYVAPSYAATPTPYHFGLAVDVKLGGTLTAATTTALASSTGTTATNIRSAKFSGDNRLVKNRLNFSATLPGRKQRQLVPMPALTGELEAEYTDDVIRDAYLADTALPLLITVTTAEALSTGFATLQIACPDIRLNGETPKPSEDEVPVLKVPFDILDGTQPIQIVLRTSDSAL